MAAAWRKMSNDDMKGLLRVADEIHFDLPEGEHVFTERLKLFPDGCFVLTEGDKNEVCGYAISHPIYHRQPPPLNGLLGGIDIAPGADQYYIHDLAILPRFRGQQLAADCITKLLTIAKRYRTTCLISVYGTTSFWGRFGFVPESIDAVLMEKLRGYGEDATYLERQNTPS